MKTASLFFRLRTLCRLPLLAAAGVGATALAVRLAYLAEFRHSPFFTHLFLDPLWHHQWALRIAAGDPPTEVFFRAPLYPWFLGLIYRLAGVNPFCPRLAQFSLGAASSVLLYFLGRRLLKSEKLAAAAGLAFAFYGPMIYFEGELLMPALIVFLDLAGLLFYLYAFTARRRTPLLYAISGLLLGLSAIARPDVLLPGVMLILPAFLWPRENFFSHRLLYAFLFAGGLFFFPLAVTVRNGLVGGEYVFIASQGGVNFYIGNNPAADGKTAVSPGLRVTAGPEYVDRVWVNSKVTAEKETGQKLSEGEVSRFWYGKAFRWLYTHPEAAFRLYLRKLFYLCHGHEIPSNNVYYFCRRFSRVLSALLWDHRIAFPGGLLIPLGIIGMILLWPARKEWAPLYLFSIFYALSILLFFVVSRYRMPLIGPLILFALAGLTRLAELFRQGARLKAGLASAVAASLLVLSNVTALGVRDDDLSMPLNEMGNYHFSRALDLRAEGKWEEATADLGRAEEYYRAALKASPDSAAALSNLGALALAVGDFGRAKKLLVRGALLNPENPGVFLNLGLACAGLGEQTCAEAAFERALQLDPGYVRAREELMRVRRRAGQ